MALLQWNDNLSVGIPSIDEQHKVLIGMINSLQDAMSSGDSRAILGEIFDGLLQYTVEHFSYEEKLLEDTGYEAAHEHKKEHNDFTTRVQELNRQFSSSSNFMIGVDVMKFLTDWLVNHIQGVDAMYTDHLVAANIQ